MSKFPKLVIAFFIILSATLTAQNANEKKGAVKGKVVDGKTGESLPGAIVLIEGTTIGANSDLDGNYSINFVTPGTYTITCKFISYVTKQIKDVKVNSGDATIVNFSLDEPKSDTLNEIVVVATLNRENTNALLVMQKNNASVSDGISGEAIKRTPDRNTSDVLKRVSGASIQDNKFAIIRGLNDRYNAAYINGAPLPSSESDRKAFSFDIFPANLLDNLIILKTATPELPADFAGGVIQINTKSIPENNFQYVSIGGGYNTITTFNNQITYKGGASDWLGLDDGKRAIPNGLPSTNELKSFTPQQRGESAKLMPNDWELLNRKFAPNLNLQYSLAQNFKAKNNIGSFGLLMALTYNNSNSYNESVRREFQEPVPGKAPEQDFELSDKNYVNNILSGVMLNLAYNINANNSISFKNMYSINTEDRVTTREGIREYYNPVKTIEKSSLRWFTENKLYTGQLTGKHLIASKYKIQWTGAYSSINRDIPNMRRMVYTKASQKNDPSDPLEPEPVFEAAIQSTGVSPTTGGTFFFSNNDEKIYSINADFSLPFNFKKYKSINDIKIGGGHQNRTRDFTARYIGFTRFGIPISGPNFQKNLLQLPEESIFAASNLGLIGPNQGGFKLDEASKLNDSYGASSLLTSAFVMVDNRLGDWFRLIWGVRLESFNQKLNSFEDDGTEVKINTTKTDILPSVNAVFSINEKQNIRLAYYNTISRPEFRELAPFGFYDFVTNFSVRGNQNLNRANINNFDVRYEIFPGRNQVFSVSGFYKNFFDAIEQINRADESRALTYQNVSFAQNYGVEFEFRVIIGSVLRADSNEFLNNLTLFSNLALIKSEVNVSNVVGAIAANRPLQGQSPYIFNAGIQYNDSKSGFGVSISANRIGRRISIVGNTQEPDIWEEGRTVIDLQIVKSFLKNKNLEVKFNVRDILAQKLYLYQDINGNETLDLNTDNIMSDTNFGQVISIGASYKF